MSLISPVWAKYFDTFKINVLFYSHKQSHHTAAKDGVEKIKRVGNCLKSDLDDVPNDILPKLTKRNTIS